MAVIWVSDEGEPPEVTGAKLQGKAGNIVALAPLNPNIEPALFPFLFPYGTPGYTLGIRFANVGKNKKENNEDEKDDEKKSGEVAKVKKKYDPRLLLYNDGIINRAKERQFVSFRQYLCYMIQVIKI